MRLKIALILFLVGALITGIGAGVAFGEYSSFRIVDSYDGKLDTKEFIYELPEGNDKGVILSNTGYAAESMSFGTDDSIPAGEIHIEVTYDPEFITPSLYTADIDEYISGKYEFSWEYFYDEYEYYNHISDSDSYMEAVERSEEEASKKREEFKEKYETAVGIEITGNPDTADSITRHKDNFLEGLKNRELRINDLDPGYYAKSIKVRINPENEDRVLNNMV